jgi:signal transduction histidine kinase
MPNWFTKRFSRSFAEPTVDEQEAQAWRILFMERSIMAPVKIVLIIFSLTFLRSMNQSLDQGFEDYARMAPLLRDQLALYSVGNLIFILILIRPSRLTFKGVRWCAFILANLDNLFLAGLIYFTGGQESVLYWIYCGLIVRNAIDFPQTYQQAAINFSVCLFYTLAVILSEETVNFFNTELYALRIAVLVLVGTSCWGVALLSERQKRRAAETREYLLRSEKLTTVGKLAAEIAHQLKNPLSIINNAAFALQRYTKEAKELPDEARAQLQIIRDEVTRSDRIISELMDYSRLSEIRIERIQINEAISDALRRCLPGAQHAEIKVITQLGDNLPALFAQRYQVEECFVNLFRNAIEAMPLGGKLEVSTSYRPPRYIQVEVRDTGIGIPKEQLGRVFDPFYTTKPTGSGMGLAIVKHIVETYGGTVEVSSREGKGTKFVLSFPIRTEQSTPDYREDI